METALSSAFTVKYGSIIVIDDINYAKALRSAGLWGCGIDGVIDAVIIAENQLYYLHNLKPIETYNKYFANVEGWEAEKTRVEKRLEIAENMRQYATVIDCYID